MLEDLAPAAFYQPNHILRLIDIALENPILSDSDASPYRVGQEYVIEAIPPLLEATAHHPKHLVRSVDLLWEFSKKRTGRSPGSGSAQGVLKRLASYDRFGWPAFNFAMLVQSIRLSRLPDAFEREFTPFDLIEMLLEREGEFTEYSDNVVSFGGFGLNIAAVGPLRQNAVDFLEFSLTSNKEVLAAKAAQLLGSLLHAYLNRVGREPQESEVEWQNVERLRALRMLTHHLEQPLSLVVRAQIYTSIRSGTGINCPEPVRAAAATALRNFKREVDLTIMDAVCTGVTDLPILAKDHGAESWESQYQQLMQEAHDALAAIPLAIKRADSLITDVKLVLGAKLEARGFSALVQSFARDPEFLTALADQVLADEHSEGIATQLSIVLDALHSYAPREFHPRAQAILRNGALPHVRAAAGSLRVYSDNATAEDVAQIKAFLAYPDAWVKRSALHAIAYMGKNVHLQADLLEASLSVNVEGDQHVATSLADAFGPYGVPLSLLKPSDVSNLLTQLLQVEDLDADQGRLPRFLNQFVDRKSVV